MSFSQFFLLLFFHLNCKTLLMIKPNKPDQGLAYINAHVHELAAFGLKCANVLTVRCNPNVLVPFLHILLYLCCSFTLHFCTEICSQSVVALTMAIKLILIQILFQRSSTFLKSLLIQAVFLPFLFKTFFSRAGDDGKRSGT